MESVVLRSRLAAAYAGRRVFVTGHTGFKGSWLVTWLNRLGADVSGYSLDPPTDPCLFEIARISEIVRSETGDVRDLDHLATAMKERDPEIVFHLAAQAIVRRSYDEPVETMTTNVMGTVNVLEAVRRLGKPCATVIVTSDKCYENRESVHGYREPDPMGGNDPYSASKGCAELVTECWRRSFSHDGASFRVATVRAGNVIGGGDWAADRIVTDCIASLCRGAPVEVRNPTAVRPWQHVLEPLSGYLWLGAKLLEDGDSKWQSPWNFGPATQDVKNVRELVEQILRAWGTGDWVDVSSGRHPAETRWLALDWSKAFRLLGWRPTWTFDEAVERTVRWYRAWKDGRGDMKELCLSQIDSYEEMAARRGAPWAETRPGEDS